MAEFAASIIAIVSAGTKVTLVLSKVGSELGSAGKEARMIASEIRSFCTVLKVLQKAVGQVENSPYYAQCKDVVADMTLASTEMFTDVLDAAESVKKIATGATKSNSGKDESMSVRQRLSWVLFKKPKITMLRASLESYKSTLVLLLGTINISERSARRLSKVPTEESLREENEDMVELESLRLAQRDSLLELESTKKRLSASLSDDVEDNHNEVLSSSILVMETEEGPNEDLREQIEILRRSVASSDSRSGVLQIADRSETHNKRATIALDPEHHRLSRAMSTISLGIAQSSAKPVPFSPQHAYQFLQSAQNDPACGEIAIGTLDAMDDGSFRDKLYKVEGWFKVLSESERSAALFALGMQMTERWVHFYIPFLQCVRDDHGAQFDQRWGAARSIGRLVRWKRISELLPTTTFTTEN